MRNPERWGKARNAHVHLRAAAADADFVAILDADDQLISATAVAELAAEYEAGFDVVWTNFVLDTGERGCSGPLDPFRAPRGQGWRSSHFFSFRAELLATVPEDYFQDGMGHWLMSACDQAIAWPMLDQTRRWKHLPQATLRYTTGNPQSHHNLDSASRHYSSREQSRNAEIVLRKPALPCRRWLLAEHAAADHALATVLRQLGRDRGEAAHPATLAAPAPVVPASDATAGASALPAQPWRDAAASLLAARCPALLSLALDGAGGAPDVALAWRWWHWLQDGAAPPRLLQIGTGPLAPVLHLLVDALGGHATSVVSDEAEGLRLHARLRAVGLEADVRLAGLADAEFDDVRARFPDMSRWTDGDGTYDVAVIGPGASPDGGRGALLALPMVAPRLQADRFRVCLWSPEDPAPLQEARCAWGRAAPELDFAAAAPGDGSLVVKAPAA